MNRIRATLCSAVLVLVATAPGHAATPAGGTRAYNATARAVRSF